MITAQSGKKMCRNLGIPLILRGTAQRSSQPSLETKREELSGSLHLGVEATTEKKITCDLPRH